MKKIIFILSLFIASLNVQAQELKCTVTVSSKQVEGTNREVFTDLQKALNEFMNNRRWTDLQYAVNERIDCTINIIVSEQTTVESFKSEIQVQARRPVYGTSYNTTILNFRDQTFNFTYRENDYLEFNDNTFGSNLTAVMAFYAYLIIGLDCDTFASFGGTPYLQKAENIVNMAQSTSESGWRALDSDRNRYSVINSILDERLRKIREFSYQYHRLGLDEMMKNPSNARARIAQSMQLLEEAHRNKSSSQAMRMFLDAKDDEIVDIFKEGTDKEKNDVYKILVAINPSKTNVYDGIKR